MLPKPILRLLAICALGLWLDPTTAIAAAGGGGGSGGLGGGGTVGRTVRSPEKDAERSYRRGLRERNSAWKHEQKALDAKTEKRRQQETEKANEDWRSAVEHYRKAIEIRSRYPEAFSSLGYALRKLGDYDASLAAYDRALQLEPGLPEALEYRAEAYLALGRLVDATRGYAKLEARDREKATQLLTAMEAWLERSEAPDAAPVTVVQRSPQWLREWVRNRRRSLEEDPAKEGVPPKEAARTGNRPIW